MYCRPNTTRMFQQVMVKKAVSASRPQCARGIESGCPVARRKPKSNPEPMARHTVRKVKGGISEIETFMAVQLKPQTTVNAPSTHHRRAGRCSCEASLKKTSGSSSRHVKGLPSDRISAIHQ